MISMFSNSLTIKVQTSQQHVALCVKGVEWELGTRDLRILAAFGAGSPVPSG